MDTDPRLAAIMDCLYRVSVKAIIINNGKLLLTKEEEDCYSLPGGGIDYGESTTKALDRELREEIEFNGCTITILPDILFVTNLEVFERVPRMQLYYRVELSEPNVIAPKELQHTWASIEDLDTLGLSLNAQEAKPQLLSILGDF